MELILFLRAGLKVRGNLVFFCLHGKGSDLAAMRNLDIFMTDLREFRK